MNQLPQPSNLEAVRHRLELLGVKHPRHAPQEVVFKALAELEERVDLDELAESNPYGPVAKIKAFLRMVRAGVPHGTATVWFAITDHVHTHKDDGICWPGKERIAEQVGITSRSAIRRINHLLELGALEVVKRGGGRHCTTRYRVNTDWTPAYGINLNPRYRGAIDTDSGTRKAGPGTNPEPPGNPEKRVTPDTDSADTVTTRVRNCDSSGQKTVSQTSHESIYESGVKPDEIDREADAPKSTGLAPSDLVAPPGADELENIIRQHWPDLTPWRQGFAKSQVEKILSEGDTTSEIAAGIARHGEWARAWGKEVYDLGAFLRYRKHRDPWDTRPKSENRATSRDSHSK